MCGLHSLCRVTNEKAKKKREQSTATNPNPVILTFPVQSQTSLSLDGPSSSFPFLPLKFLIFPLQKHSEKKTTDGKQKETMSVVAPSSNPSLCYSALSRTVTPTKQNPCLPFPSRHPILPKTLSSPETLVNFCNTQLPRPSILIVRASAASESEPAKLDGGEGEGEFEEYEVELDKPYGLKFVKGRDGATYIDAIAPGGSADISGKFSVWDKVIATRSCSTFFSPFLYLVEFLGLI